ncbi:MAG: hypothetical protein Q9197_006817, partial [Variospora fuerteventurae]
QIANPHRLSTEKRQNATERPASTSSKQIRCRLPPVPLLGSSPLTNERHLTSNRASASSARFPETAIILVAVTRSTDFPLSATRGFDKYSQRNAWRQQLSLDGRYFIEPPKFFRSDERHVFSFFRDAWVQHFLLGQFISDCCERGSTAQHLSAIPSPWRMATTATDQPQLYDIIPSR